MFKMDAQSVAGAVGLVVSGRSDPRRRALAALIGIKEHSRLLGLLICVNPRQKHALDADHHQVSRVVKI